MHERLYQWNIDHLIQSNAIIKCVKFLESCINSSQHHLCLLRSTLHLQKLKTWENIWATFYWKSKWQTGCGDIFLVWKNCFNRSDGFISMGSLPLCVIMKYYINLLRFFLKYTLIDNETMWQQILSDKVLNINWMEYDNVCVHCLLSVCWVLHICTCSLNSSLDWIKLFVKDLTGKNVNCKSKTRLTFGWLKIFNFLLQIVWAHLKNLGGIQMVNSEKGKVF